MPHSFEPKHEHSEERNSQSGTGSQGVVPDYPVNEEAMNVSLYGNNTGIDGYSVSLEKETAARAAENTDDEDALENHQPAEEPIQSEQLRYENADRIYE